MLRACTRRADGLMLYVFGLSEDNCRRLLANQPIVFDGAELETPECCFCITCQHPDGRVAVPRQLAKEPKLMVTLPILAENLGPEPDDPHGRIIAETSSKTTDKIIVFRCRDEQLMYELCKGFLGPNVDLRLEGFPPGTFQSQN